GYYMKRLILNLFLVAAIVVLAASVGYAQDQGFSSTENQQNFAIAVKALPNIIQATWQSPLDLWVYADGVNKGNAQAIAEKVILLAQTNFGQSICVHVHNGDFNPLATKCWSSL
ncbi:MAG: hypothetical protein ACHQ6U_13805, partial [Thermodesulfobacteriota bacterium]